MGRPLGFAAPLVVGLVSAVTSLPAKGGYPADVELLRPTFSRGAILGVDSPVVDAPGTVRFGVLAQYERNPLVLYQGGVLTETVVANRNVVHAGISWDASERVSIRAVLPVAAQWGSTSTWYDGDGAGLGDLSIGARIGGIEAGPMVVGARADLFAPTGRDDAWIGESGARGSSGLLAMIPLGRFDVAADAGVTARAPVATGADFTLGSELSYGAGGRYLLPGERASLQASLLGRSGFSELFAAGGDDALEAVVGVRLHPHPDVQFDLGAGHGLTRGYGTTDARVVGGVTFTRVRRPPASALVDPLLGAEDVPEAVPPPELPDFGDWDDPWGEAELARVIAEEIAIKEAIQFERDTANLRDESLLTLAYVADLLNARPEILHVVIIGHASEEGTFPYNYGLSVLRARTLFEALVTAGVDPSRLSYRGMGEVDPAVLGSEEDFLAPNRRATFQILVVAGPEQALPVYPRRPVPWNGELRADPPLAPSPRVLEESP
jgi:outer membrane protein OmpA-like peptidoglycan-associated protein